MLQHLSVACLHCLAICLVQLRPSEGKCQAWVGDCTNAGSGANQALRDGFQLAEQLGNPEHASLGAAVAAYDDASGPRVTHAIMDGRKNIAVAHSRGWQQTKFVIIYTIAGWVLAFKAWVMGLKH